jgi:hypothetical protein
MISILSNGFLHCLYSKMCVAFSFSPSYSPAHSFMLAVILHFSSRHFLKSCYCPIFHLQNPEQTRYFGPITFLTPSKSPFQSEAEISHFSRPYPFPSKTNLRFLVGQTTSNDLLKSVHLFVSLLRCFLLLLLLKHYDLSRFFALISMRSKIRS